jgi:hypothetical protein
MHCGVVQEIGEANIAGICFYMQMSMTLAVADGHLVNMGKMIEEMEGKLRNSLDQVTVLHWQWKLGQILRSPKVIDIILQPASSLVSMLNIGLGRFTLGRPEKWFALFGRHQKFWTWDYLTAELMHGDVKLTALHSPFMVFFSFYLFFHLY